MDSSYEEGPNEDHYVLSLDVKRVTPPPTKKETSSYGQGATELPTKKVVSSVTRLVIRSSTLEGLVAKANQHLLLIQED